MVRAHAEELENEALTADNAVSAFLFAQDLKFCGLCLIPKHEACPFSEQAPYLPAILLSTGRWLLCLANHPF